MSVHESIFGVPLLTNIKSCSTLYQDTRLYHVSDAMNSHQELFIQMNLGSIIFYKLYNINTQFYTIL